MWMSERPADGAGQRHRGELRAGGNRDAGKVVLRDSANTNVDYDVPGSEQRFAVQRAERDAEDRAVLMAAEAIRNRLASFFVAGT